MAKNRAKPSPVEVTFKQGDIEITVSYENYDEFCNALERESKNYRKFLGMRELVETMQLDLNRQF